MKRDVASVAYSRGNDAGHAGKVRGEASDDDHALCLAADNGNAEGDVGFTAGATCLAGIGRIAEQGLDAEVTEGVRLRALGGASEDWGVWSIFQSLLWTTRIPAASRQRAVDSGTECDIGKVSTLKGPRWRRWPRR